MSVAAFARIVSCCALVLSTTMAVPVMAAPDVKPGPGLAPLCIDGMETEPGYDDLEPVPVSAQLDGGCLASLQPVSI